MRAFRRVLPSAAALLLAGLPAVSAQPAPDDVREREGRAARPAAEPAARRGLAELERRLGRAVDSVSLARPAALVGRSSARAYRLPGYGVVIVLSPRLLPGGERQLLRPRTRVQLRRFGAAPDAEPPADPEALERQAVVLQHEAERARREAEEDMERIVQDVRIRLAPEDAETGNVAPPAPPQAPQAPGPADGAADSPAPPPPPPWKFWFETALPADTRSAATLVADVRRSLLSALESAPVAALRPDEFLTVAVDFEPAAVFLRPQPPERTLVVRARARDLQARSRGALSAAELQRRVEMIEY